MFKKVLKFLFFILLTVNFQEVFATDQTYTLIKGYAGSSNRIRRYDQFVYTYDQQKGFFCRPESVKGSLYTIEDTGTPKTSPIKFYSTESTDILNSIKDVGEKTVQQITSLLSKLIENPGTLAATVGAEVIDSLLTPVMCTGIISTYMKTGLGGGTVITLLLQLINTFLGTIIYEYLGGNDYGIDINNPNCAAMTSIMLASCVTYFILNKTLGPFDKVTLVAYVVLVAAYSLAKLIQGNIQEARAIDNYNKLNLCGDDWYTFGNSQLIKSGITLAEDGDQVKFPELTDTNSKLSAVIDPEDLTKTVFAYYPTKSTALPGSYKFMLDGCINEIQSVNNSTNSSSAAGYCSLIGVKKKDYIVNGKVILSMNNKIFREREYGGVEIMFEANNSNNNYFENCYDPRPEAANYDIYAFIPEKKDRKQVYYARGMDGLNFACERWQNKKAYRSAFECCVQASKRFICVNYHSPNSTAGVENLFFDQGAFQKRYKNYYKEANKTKYENINMFCDINKTSCKINKKTLEKSNSLTIDFNTSKCDLKNYKTEDANDKSKKNDSTLANIFVDNNFTIDKDDHNILKTIIITSDITQNSISNFSEVASINDMVKFYVSQCNDDNKKEKLSTICNEKSSITNVQIAAIKYAKNNECSKNENNTVCKCLAKINNVSKTELKKKYTDYSNSENSDEIICSSILGNICSITMEKNLKGTTGKTIGNLGIELKLSPSETDSDTKYCIKTQSFCPFDFNIAGGTEKVGNQFRKKLVLKKNSLTLEQTDCIQKDSSGQCQKKTFGLCQIKDTQSDEVIEYLDCNNKDSNFCQFQRHCQLINEYVVLDEKIPDNPYLDKACINFVGSSKLNANYAPYYSYKPVKNPFYGHFTAPIIECIVETAKNQLYNKAGRTICNNPNEVPNDDPDTTLAKDICTTGVRYRKGDTILGDNANIFHNLRKKLRRLYLVLLTLSIVCYALKVVTFNHETSFPELTKHLFKIVFVISFSYNSQWVNIALNSVFDLTDTVILSTIKFMQIDSLIPSYTNSSFDGCYFASDPFYTEDKDAKQNDELPKSQWKPYESGRGYVALLDMIDCKIRLYLGMTVTNSALSILLICILIILTGSIIMVLILPLIFIFISIFLLTMKVAYMLMVTLLSMVILLFAAPVIIPMILFDKTKAIFDKWLSSIIGFMFYTMFFVIAITLVFLFISTTFLNGARFTGTQNAPFRNLYCGHTCKLTLGTKTVDTMISETEIENCKNQGGEVTDLRSESLFCFLNTSHTEVSKGGGFLDFLIPNLNLRMLDVKTIKNSWSLLFSQGLIILLVFIMADEILDAVLKLGSNIFGVAVSNDLVPSIAKAMGDITSSIANKLFDNSAMNALKWGAYAAREGMSHARKGGKIERTSTESSITAEIKDNDDKK